MSQNVMAIIRPFEARSAVYGISSASVLWPNGGRKLVRVSVTDASGTAGTIYDAPSLAATNGNAICTVPATVGVYSIQWPTQSGIVVVPGAGQVLSISLA